MGDVEHRIEGYRRCRCGTLILDYWAEQTGGRCLTCWRDHHPLKQIEVMNRGARVLLRSTRRRKGSRGNPDTERKARAAQEAAWRRLAQIHPDLYAMLYDEERAERGLPPIVRYEADWEETTAKTLAWDGVYDALRSSGVNDA